ncbi:MAG: hypothetical protein SVW02_01200 [Candidatus Nanohaloarchaea archaeon]|nr:hypothetical protein [Candidatus Nanohaloarchaea archaeon]
MKVKTTFIASIMFLGMLSMLIWVHAEINENYDVQNNRTADVRDQYRDLSNTVQSNNESNPGIKERLAAVTGANEDSNVFSQVSAGLYLIPQLFSLLIKPLAIMDAALGSIVEQIPFLPEPVTFFVRNLFRAAVVFGVVAAFLGIREV